MKESMKNASISANKQNCAPQIRKDCFSRCRFRKFLFRNKIEAELFVTFKKKKWHNGEKLYRNPSSLSTDSLVIESTRRIFHIHPRCHYRHLSFFFIRIKKFEIFRPRFIDDEVAIVDCIYLRENLKKKNSFANTKWKNR